jgi:ABC transport system ATP-binding/permease protein
MSSLRSDPAGVGPVLVVRTRQSDHRLQAGTSYRLGRDPKSDIVVTDPRVSWRHAVLRHEQDTWILEDAGSTNGTFVEDRRVSRFAISAECVVRFGDPDDGPVVRCQPDQPVASRGGPPAAAEADDYRLSVDRRPTAVLPLPVRRLRIGRTPDNDLVLSDLGVSRHHAELRKSGNGQYEIADLGSHNGTFVNGQRVGSAALTEQDIVGIGPATFRLTGDELREYIDTGDVSLVAQDLVVQVSGGKVLLDHVSFPLAERCLLGIIGPSGAGKSTLLGALTGMRPADRGAVLYDNRDLYRD